jgi:DNA repair exonuclease SbcCD ATPase subunit
VENEDDLFREEPSGPVVLPGMYKVSLAKRVDGKITPLAGPVEFVVAVAGDSSMDLADRKALQEFQQKVARLQRAVSGTLEAANELAGRLDQAKRALDQTPAIDSRWKDFARNLEKRNRAILMALRGDTALRARNENTPVSIVERVSTIVGNQRLSVVHPTKTDMDACTIAGQEFSQELEKLRTLIEVDFRSLEKALDAAGAPWTPGRLPEWKEK